MFGRSFIKNVKFFSVGWHLPATPTRHHVGLARTCAGSGRKQTTPPATPRQRAPHACPTRLPTRPLRPKRKTSKTREEARLSYGAPVQCLTSERHMLQSLSPLRANKKGVSKGRKVARKFVRTFWDFWHLQAVKYSTTL